MREIKFRAWDKTIKKMYPTIVERFSLSSLIYGMEEIVFMQFTGLLDKNGKEIYEGDIVKWREHPNKTVEASEVKWSPCLRWVLVWFADNFEREKNYPSTKDLGGHINSIEIIGNIYENPELLG